MMLTQFAFAVVNHLCLAASKGQRNASRNSDADGSKGEGSPAVQLSEVQSCPSETSTNMGLATFVKRSRRGSET